NRTREGVSEMRAPCHTCHRPFTPQRSTARFCSPRCRVAAQRARDRGTPIRVAATRPSVAADAVLSVTATVEMSEGQKPQSVTLRRLDPRIIPDEHWPGMYRIRRPDRTPTHTVHLSTAQEAPGD